MSDTLARWYIAHYTIQEIRLEIYTAQLRTIAFDALHWHQHDQLKAWHDMMKFYE